MAVEFDFTNPEFYTDEFAERYGDWPSYKELSKTPLFINMRKVLEDGEDFQESLEKNITDLMPPFLRDYGSLSFVIGEDGKNLSMSEEAATSLTEEYNQQLDIILTFGGK